MSLSSNRNDTIFALASAAGRSAVAVVRLSGGQALEVLLAIAPGGAFKPREATLRKLRDPLSGDVLDTGLVLTFPAPRSFTGEAMVELQVTGGRAVVRALFEVLGHLGLRPAEPGEFAWRAFLNGKLDLSSGRRDSLIQSSRRRRACSTSPEALRLGQAGNSGGSRTPFAAT